MIQVIDDTNANANANREMLRAFSALRYEVFVERLGWRLHCREPGLEQDQFDGQGATYLLATSQSGELLGGARLLDTSRRSLLAEVFPYLVNGPLPADNRIVDVTRFVVSPRAQTASGPSVCMELLWGIQAYGLWAGLTHLVSVSYLSMEPIFRRAGYRSRRLGTVREMDGVEVAAFEHDVDAAVLERSRRRVAADCAFRPPFIGTGEQESVALLPALGNA